MAEDCWFKITAEEISASEVNENCLSLPEQQPPKYLEGTNKTSDHSGGHPQKTLYKGVYCTNMK